MKRLGVFLCVFGLALCTPPVSKTRDQIEKFRQALENSRIVKCLLRLGAGLTVGYLSTLNPVLFETARIMRKFFALEFQQLVVWAIRSTSDDGVLLESRMLANPNANIWENSGKFQGDILLDDSQVEELLADYASDGISGRAAQANSRWPNNLVIFAFGANEFDAAQEQAILMGMRWVEHFSCVRFRRRTTEPHFVTIRGRPSGCYAHVGFSSVHQHVINLARNTPGRGCLNNIIIIHELLHALGFWHMMQAYERNNYVRINTQNISPGAEHNFARLARNRVSLLSLPYEFTSSMHYSTHAFSRNGQPTITALRSFTGTMGHMVYVTHLDWVRLRRHYNCPGAWNERAIQEMQEEVERTLPLLKMNAPAPSKKHFVNDNIVIDEDVTVNKDEAVNEYNIVDDEAVKINEVGNDNIVDVI